MREKFSTSFFFTLKRTKYKKSSDDYDDEIDSYCLRLRFVGRRIINKFDEAMDFVLPQAKNIQIILFKQEKNCNKIRGLLGE
jgi:hypothetical protein